MSEIQQFSALVGAIHDASHGQPAWTRVLEKICAFVPGAVGTIFLQDGVAKAMHLGFNCELEAACNELYPTRYITMNPILSALLFCEAGEIFCSSDLVPAAQMVQTRFCREYLQPLGLGETVGAVLEKSATSFAVLAVILTGNLGRVEHSSVERVRLLVPHIQRAVLTGKAIDLPRMSAEIHKATLSPSTFPELIAKQFRLTPAELGVMFSFIEVGDVPEVASILGLSPTTIGMHLRSIRGKTGTKDQADLVKLVARLANPVLNWIIS